MKLIDNNTSTEVEFRPPHRFSMIQTLKVVATTYAFMREFSSDQPVDELIESLQQDGDAMVVTWSRKPTAHEQRDIEWIWEHVCGQETTRHRFDDNTST